MNDYEENAYAEESLAPQAPAVPHDSQAEEALLGAVLINPEVYAEVAQILKAEDFFILRHRWIWEAITRLSEARQPVDVLTVAEELARAGHLDDIGGQAYLVRLTTAVPSSLHATHYARLVEEAAVRRRMLAAAEKIAQLAHQRDLGVEAILDEAEKTLFNVSERRITRGVKPFRDVLREYYDYLDHLRTHQNEAVGIPTGFYDLDRLLNGLQPSDLIIVAGRPGMGKTGFLLSIAKNAAQRHKKHVAIFSLEMANEQLVQRLLAQETRIDSQRLRTGQISDSEWQTLTQAVDTLSEAPIFLDDTPAITPIQLRTKCRRLHMEYGLDLIMVDYLQLMTSGMRSENRVQEVSQISRNLKALARELNVPVVAAAQLSRAVEQRQDKRPMLSDLRESGSLEQDADVVMFIYRDEVYREDTDKIGIAEIIIAKHRNGPTGSVDLLFLKELAKFENAATANIEANAYIPPQG
ncbi:MAG: replicative DNA helicase [Chloroflexi bacterium]|nr:replicative DNA helicase [Chloroflexota bacterium]